MHFTGNISVLRLLLMGQFKSKIMFSLQQLIHSFEIDIGYASTDFGNVCTEFGNVCTDHGNFFELTLACMCSDLGMCVLTLACVY